MTSRFHTMGPMSRNQAQRCFVEFTGHHLDVRQRQHYVWSRSPDGAGGIGGEDAVTVTKVFLLCFLLQSHLHIFSDR